MEIKSAPVVTVKDKAKEIYPHAKNSLEILDFKIQKMRDIKFCVNN
jgi:hypothetical protein